MGMEIGPALHEGKHLLTVTVDPAETLARMENSHFIF